MKKALFFSVIVFSILTPCLSQSKENLKVVKNVVHLSTELEFTDVVKLFDSAGRKRVSPFILHYLWNGAREKYGQFTGSSTKKSYIKNNKEYIIEELKFDSGFIDMKFGFNAQHQISTYLMIKEQSLADFELEKKYSLPPYGKKSKVEVKEVAFGTAPYIMHGELTLPAGLKRRQKVPVVVLVHGSGPNDRDSKSGPLKPFKDIAYGLANRGIAVLRYDKRTYEYVEECANDLQFTVNSETVDDALAAAIFLHKQKHIDKNKIYILGHSLGGMMLPRIAQMDTTLAGVIFMAAPAKSLPDKVIEQCDYLLAIDPENEKSYKKMKEGYVLLKTKWYDSNTKAQYLPAGVPPVYWMDLDAYNQTEVVKQAKIPMLFIQGARDYQVTVEDFELWKQTLKDNPNAKFVLLEKLNHMMTAGEGEGHSKPSEYKIPGNVAVEVIDAIETFIK